MGLVTCIKMEKMELVRFPTSIVTCQVNIMAQVMPSVPTVQEEKKFPQSFPPHVPILTYAHTNNNIKLCKIYTIVHESLYSGELRGHVSTDSLMKYFGDVRQDNPPYTHRLTMDKCFKELEFLIHAVCNSFYIHLFIIVSKTFASCQSQSIMKSFDYWAVWWYCVP